MRLDKYLADMNAGTRKELKTAIRKGLVTVDGQVVRDAGFHVTGNETISFDGEVIGYQAFEYYMLNKPAGVISATEDKRHKTVLDLLGERRRRDLFPVGRLDIDTTGLLLITNDGALAHRLLSPKHHVDKVYRATVTGTVSESDIRAFAEGLRIDDGLTAMPAELRLLEARQNSAEAVSFVEVTIREGKFHQVKRMFEAVGKKVLTLQRISMGPLVLDKDLPEGKARPLTEGEIETLRSLS